MDRLGSGSALTLSMTGSSVKNALHLPGPAAASERGRKAEDGMANVFIIRGQRFSIEGFAPSLDREFIALHAAFLSSSTCQWDPFVAAGQAYFSKPVGKL
jgi:hypothetical protein